MRFCEFVGCKYPVFGSDKVTGKGYCRSHQTQRTDFDRRTIIQKAIAKNNNLQSKIRGLGNAAVVEEKNELELWFLMHMNTSPKVCENCGANLSHYDEKDWYGSQHHVLEKSIFKSVKANTINHVVLGKWCCHSQFHTSMLNASKMKIFKKCIEIVKTLHPFLTDAEKGKISEYYGTMD